jgi:hypothetical protein
MVIAQTSWTWGRTIDRPSNDFGWFGACSSPETPEHGRTTEYRTFTRDRQPAVRRQKNEFNTSFGYANIADCPMKE